MKSLPPGKINPTKLLGSSSFSSKKTSVSLNKLKPEGENDFSIIKKQVLEIKNLVTNITLSKKNEEERKRKEQEQEKFEGTEKKLEKKKPKETGIKLPSAPKLGFLDRIKNFLFNTFLGFIAVRLIEHLPKLIGVAKFLGGTLDFLTSVGGTLLNGLVTFVEKGYEVADFTRNQLRNFGGEGAVEKFDTLNKAFENIIFAAIAASLALGNLGSGGEKGGGPGGKPARRGFDATGRRVGVNTQKRFAEKYGRDEFIKRFGKDNLKNLPKSMQRSALTKFGRKAVVGALGKGGTKTALKVVAPLVRNIPLIGGVMEFVLSWMSGDPVGKAAFKGVGAGLGTWIGGALGSLIPIPGVGTAIGMWLGSAGGSKLGEVIYDKIFNSKDSPQKPQESIKAAGGGRAPATRGGRIVTGPAKRKITKARRTITVQSTPIKPGASIGGEKQIEKVFPRSKESGTVNPLGYIEDTYKKTSEAPYFGALMGIATKAVVGQKPSPIDYKNAAQGLSNWMNVTFSDEVLRTGAIAAAGGGQINAEMLSKSSGDMTNVIAKSLEENISKKVDDAINDLMKQMMLKPEEPDDKDKPKAPNANDMGEGVGVQVSSDSPDFWILATAAMFENSHPQGAADAAQAIYNRVAMPGDPWKVNNSIRKAILNPGQFQPVRQYGGTASWAAIKTKDDALKFIRSHRKTPAQLETVAAALLDKEKQNSARQFVGPRDSFRSVAYENANNHLADDTEVRRHGHVFGFEPRGATIGSFRAGKLTAASVNANVMGNVNLKGGDGSFIQGNSGRSAGTHFHIGTNKPGDASGVASAGFGVIKRFLGKKSVYVGRSGETIPTNATDDQIKGYIGRGQAAHRQTELDLQIGGTGAGNKVPFPLGLSGMKYSSTDGYGVSANIVGTNAFVGHGRYKPDGSLAPQQRMVLNSGAPDFYAFHGMNKLMTKDSTIGVHKGEYVSITDKDSVDLLGKDFIATINSIENQSQLRNKADSLISTISHIAGYEPGGQQDVVVEEPEPEIVYITTPVPVGGGAMIMGGSSGGPTLGEGLYERG